MISARKSLEVVVYLSFVLFWNTLELYGILVLNNENKILKIFKQRNWLILNNYTMKYDVKRLNIEEENINTCFFSFYLFI